MQVRRRSEKRRRFYFGRRQLMSVARWAFIVLGTLTTAFVLFSHLYYVNESIYDPSLFAIGVGGLFTIACGIILMIAASNGSKDRELLIAATRCEELADHIWALREAEQRATSLLESQGDLIVRRDREGRITYANDAFCTLSGKPREALLGTTTNLKVTEQGKTDTLADGTRMHDQKIMTRDGERWLAWRDVMVWEESDDCAETQSVGRDVTARIQAEHSLADARDAAESASLAKSRFLAMVSHEIRTPLNGILGMAGLLLDTTLTQEQIAYVKAAKTSGDALLSLIEEILDFSKIEAGKLELAAEPFALAALVEEVVELLGPRAQAKGLEIASDIDESLPERVIGDATRLRQVLLNLAGNAIKFTETGGVSVVVEPGPGRGEIAFEVHDTGIGIAADEQARIFNEFEQADSGAARKFGGTGLGLAISKRIVERMGGRIDVESTPGNGAAFRVIVKLVVPDGAQAVSFTPPDLIGTSALIVAPDSIAAAMLQRRLTRWGANTATVDTETAVSAISKQHWDLALIDHTLGEDAVRSFVRQAGVSIPRRIVLVTPGERHALASLKDAGCTGYLVKPVRVASLAARLTDDDSFDTPAVAAATQTDTPAVEFGTAESKLAILIAEDNEINALLARALLAKLGHRPTIAASGEAALASWNAARDQGAPYDLVLMDVHMPGLDGIEAARRIRAAETEANGHRTPIFALTANAFAEDRDACLGAGMDGFLVKPLNRERLAATLADLQDRATLAA